MCVFDILIVKGRSKIKITNQKSKKKIQKNKLNIKQELPNNIWITTIFFHQQIYRKKSGILFQKTNNNTKNLILVI